MISRNQLSLIEHYLDGTLDSSDVAALQKLLLESEEARASLRTLATIEFGLQDAASGGDWAVDRDFESVASQKKDSEIVMGGLPRYAKVLFAIAATTILLLGAGLYLQDRSVDARVAQAGGAANAPVVHVKTLGGPILWTGGGGRVTSDLVAGQQLAGGTVEGLAPGSWIELEFLDGTTVTIAGYSTLTYSDDGQKILRLKSGNVSAKVSPQPMGKPMLVHTLTSTIQVVGTQFELETDAESTLVNVNEGSVQVERLNDGRVVEVKANERVSATPGSRMEPQKIPASVSNWTSRLESGPAGTMGKWVPQTNENPPALRTIPYVHTLPDGQRMALAAAAILVSTGETAPVVLQQDSKLRFEGDLRKADWIVFGVTIQKPEGGFGGNFFALTQLAEVAVDNRRELILDLDQLILDPALKDRSEEMLGNPSEGVIQAVWCSTDANAIGVEIHRIELGAE
jgi:hypothetical protein